MRKSASIIGCIVTGTVGTAVLATASILYLMVTTSADVFKRTALFGAVVFSSEKTATGNLQIGAGIESLPALGAVWLGVTLSITLVYIVLKQIIKYRRFLRQAS